MDGTGGAQSREYQEKGTHAAVLWREPADWVQTPALLLRVLGPVS